MQLKILTKPQDPRFLLVEINGEIWKEIYKSLFVRDLKLFYRCSSLRELQELWPRIEKKAAEEAIRRLLLRKNYFSEELRAHLRTKKISESAIEQAIEKYKGLGHVDDERWRERFIELEQRKGKGPRYIAAKLKTKGVHPHVALDQEAAIRNLLATRLQKYDLNDPKQRHKVVLALLRRGFDFQSINSLLTSFD